MKLSLSQRNTKAKKNSLLPLSPGFNCKDKHSITANGILKQQNFYRSFNEVNALIARMAVIVKTIGRGGVRSVPRYKNRNVFGFGKAMMVTTTQNYNAPEHRSTFQTKQKNKVSIKPLLKSERHDKKIQEKVLNKDKCLKDFLQSNVRHRTLFNGK